MGSTPQALLFNAIRTQRGRGKSTGSLNEVKPVKLLTTLMHEMQRRHDLDTSQVEDVVIGCVTPVGDQGAVIAKTAALAAGWDERQVATAAVTQAETAAQAADSVETAGHIGTYLIGPRREALERIRKGELREAAINKLLSDKARREDGVLAEDEAGMI